MKAAEIIDKVAMQKLIAGEVKYAKQHKQHMVWVYWNYKLGQMNFLDTFEEFKEVVVHYASQEFIKDQELSNYDLSEIAKIVGAKEVKRHIFVNRQMIMNNDTAHPVEPVSLFLADRMNAGNEFVVVQIKCC